MSKYKSNLFIPGHTLDRLERGLNSNADSLIIDLDGACVSCGAAPGTLKGIQDDLLIDNEIISVRFSISMLEWFDEIQKEFVVKFGGVVFV